MLHCLLTSVQTGDGRLLRPGKGLPEVPIPEWDAVFLVEPHRVTQKETLQAASAIESRGISGWSVERDTLADSSRSQLSMRGNHRSWKSDRQHPLRIGRFVTVLAEKGLCSPMNM